MAKFSWVSLTAALAPILLACGDGISDQITKPIILFSGSATGGAFSTRAIADSNCETTRPIELPDKTCESTRALVSIDATDAAIDMPENYSFSADRPISSENGTQIAESWADLFDGSIDSNLEDAGVFPPSSFYWTGTNGDGALGGFSCENWTNTGATGIVGSSGSTNSGWMNSTTTGCLLSNLLLCICL